MVPPGSPDPTGHAARAGEALAPDPGTHRVRRVLLAALMALLSVNVWTGSPLVAVWVGSRVQGDGPPSMGAIAVVAITLLALSVTLVLILGRVSAAYDREMGVHQVRKHVPWLRSMRGERELYEGERPMLSMLDRVLVVTVVVAVVAFEIWFFFFSGSPIDQRTGRHTQVPTMVVDRGADQSASSRS